MVAHTFCASTHSGGRGREISELEANLVYRDPGWVNWEREGGREREREGEEGGRGGEIQSTRGFHSTQLEWLFPQDNAVKDVEREDHQWEWELVEPHVKLHDGSSKS